MEKEYVRGRMEELVEHFKPVRIRQLRDTYWFTILSNRVITITFCGKDDEGRNLYEGLVS
jgi:hypothetical protein